MAELPQPGINNAEVGLDYHSEPIDRTVYWTEPNLKITRLRLISDRGFPYWDVSYCHGRVGDKKVRVSLPFSQIPKFYAPEAKIPGVGQYKQFIINMGNKENPPLFVKKTGILDSFAMLQM